MKKVNILLVVLITLMISIIVTQRNQPVVASGNQQWEYAMMFNSSENGTQTFRSLVADPDEKARLDSGLAQFGAPASEINLNPPGATPSATPFIIPDIYAPIKALDYMGSLGWELIATTETYSNNGTFTVYTFMRPIN